MRASTCKNAYPECEFGGFTRVNGTIEFYLRVQSLLRPDQAVLDIGCGRGAWIENGNRLTHQLRGLQGERRSVLGIDVDPNASANSALDNFRLIDDVRRWPVDDASIDVACSDYVLEHVEDPGQFFAEAWRTLKPGGYLCLRTPNCWSYVALAARLVPNRLHAKVLSVSQHARKEEDVFPTVYRCNTRRKIGRAMLRQGFDCHAYTMEAEPAYLDFSPLAYRIAAVVHRILPPTFRSTLLAFARKPTAVEQESRDLAKADSKNLRAA